MKSHDNNEVLNVLELCIEGFRDTHDRMNRKTHKRQQGTAYQKAAFAQERAIELFKRMHHEL